MRPNRDVLPLWTRSAARSLAIVVAAVLAIAFVGSLIQGTPTKLPGIAVGWPLLLHLMRACIAAALVGAVAVIVLKLWEGALPTKLSTGGVEWPATDGVERDLREQLVRVDQEFKNAVEQLARRVEEVAAGATSEEPPQAAEGVENALGRVKRELGIAVEKNALADAIADLPEHERLVIALTEYEGLPPKEAASVLGLSVAQVSRLRARAYQTLGARLGRKPFPRGRN